MVGEDHHELAGDVAGEHILETWGPSLRLDDASAVLAIIDCPQGHVRSRRCSRSSSMRCSMDHASRAIALKEVNGIAYRKKGDRDKAISDYCKALRIDPSDQTPSAI